jgi:hypothetical protein
MAFHVKEVLERFRVLNLQFRIAIKTFVSFLQEEAEVWIGTKDISKNLSSCSRIYRYIRSQIDMGCGNVGESLRPRCPCCHLNPKGVSSIAVDASMSFKGIETGDMRTPLFGERYIMKDLSAEEILNDKKYKPEDRDCDNFRADNNDTADKKFRHQGIAGSICKHHIIGDFLYLVHGKEAYIFALKLLLKHLDTVEVRTLLFKYDICCNFLRYLKV